MVRLVNIKEVGVAFNKKDVGLEIISALD